MKSISLLANLSFLFAISCGSNVLNLRGENPNTAETDSQIQLVGSSFSILLDRDKCIVIDKVITTNDNNLLAYAACSTRSGIERHLYKISPSGEKIWAKPYMPPKALNRFYDLAVDSEDNIILSAGYSETSSLNNLDYSSKETAALIKLDSNGKFLWEYKKEPSTTLPADSQTIDTIIFPSIAINGTDILVSEGDYYFKSNKVMIREGVYQEQGIKNMKVSYFKLDANKKLSWQSEKELIDLNNPENSPNYSFINKDLGYSNELYTSTFPLNIIYKGGLLYAQHGALRRIFNASSGAMLQSTSSDFFYGGLFLGMDGKIYSYGTSTKGDDHPMYYKEIVTYDDGFNQTDVTKINQLPPSFYNSKSNTVYPRAIAIDDSSNIYITSMHCESTKVGCGTYTAKMQHVSNGESTIIWDNTYETDSYGARGLSVAIDDSNVYVGSQFNQRSKYKKGILKYKK